MEIKRKKSKYTYNEENYKGYLMKALVSNQIRENPYYTKYVIDSLIDAQTKWNELEQIRRLRNPSATTKRCPISHETITWISKYFLIMKENGDHILNKYLDSTD